MALFKRFDLVTTVGINAEIIANAQVILTVQAQVVSALQNPMESANASAKNVDVTKDVGQDETKYHMATLVVEIFAAVY